MGLVPRLLGAFAIVCTTGILAAVGAWAEDAPSKGDPERGETLYLRYCRGCHGEDGRGDAMVFMPHVNNLTKKGYVDLLPDAYLFTAISKGGLAIGKSSYMPAWGETLSEEQILDIIAHLRRLPLF